MLFVGEELESAQALMYEVDKAPGFGYILDARLRGYPDDYIEMAEPQEFCGRCRIA